VNPHQVLVEQLLQRVWDKGDIYKAKYEGEDTCTQLNEQQRVTQTSVIATTQFSIVCQAALAHACRQKDSCHAVLYAVTVGVKAVSSLDKAVLACSAHTHVLVGIDHACL